MAKGSAGRRAQRASWIGLGLLWLVGSGCIPGYVRISVDAGRDVNQKQPVYMLVRTLDRKAYMGESYGDVAGKLVDNDPSVLRKELLFPGASRSVYIKKPKGALGIFFLFTAPGGTWRLFVDAPLPLAVKAQLKGNRLVEDSTQF